MTPAAIYARYSTDEQDPRSIDDQIRRCGDYAKRGGFEVVGEFTDAAISGAHTDRLQLRRMLDVATATRRPPFRAVIVDDLSRLARNIGDFWRMIDDLAAAGVRVIDVQTGMSSEDPNARQMFGFKSLMNDAFLQTIRYQTHRGLEGRAIAGFSTGGSLYGYRTHAEANAHDVDHPRKVWEIDEDQAAIVRRIFRMVDEGHSYRAMADVLNREAVPAPRNNGRGGKHGAGWSHMTIRAILTSPKYIGTWTWNASKWIPVPGKSTRRRVARPETEHVVNEYPELAIIDRATWDRVQARMTKRGHGDERTARKGQQTTLVSGLLRCGTCSGPLSVRSAKHKAGVRYINYGCTAHSSRGGAICANATTISERKISAALLAALRELLTGPAVAEAFATAFARRVAERTKGTKAPDLDGALRAAQTRVANATRLMVEMPDDLDIRALRETDKAEVRRLADAISERAEIVPRAIPTPAALRAAVGSFLDVLADADPARGREALARVMSPLVVTPKTEGPNRFSVVGSLDVALVAANGSSGGRI